MVEESGRAMGASRVPVRLITMLALVALAPARARSSGLLLGTDAYRSFWISAAPAGPTVVELPGTIIPRRSGFWRLHRAYEVWPDSSEGEPGGSERRLDSEELWSFAPAAGAPSLKSRPGRRLAREAPSGPTCEETFYRPSYIGPRWISYQRVTSDECGVHPDASTELHVAALDDWRGRRFSVSELLGAGAAAAFRDSLIAATVHYHEVWAGQDCGDPDWDEQKWAVARDRGRWIARGWADTQRLCGFGFEFGTAAALPESVVTGNRLAVPWEEVARSVPEAYDAMTSPGGDLLVALSPNELLAFALKDGKLVGPPARHPFGTGRQPSTEPTDNAVLVEWALGRAVERWTQALSAQGSPPAGR